MKLERLALAAGARRRARSGRGLFEAEVDRCRRRRLRGNLFPKRSRGPLVEQRVVERVVADVLETAAPNGLEAALSSSSWSQSVLQSPAPRADRRRGGEPDPPRSPSCGSCAAPPSGAR